jgi:hypothetical protein
VPAEVAREIVERGTFECGGLGSGPARFDTVAAFAERRDVASGPDGMDGRERLVRAGYRWRSWLLCRLGRHLWALRRNPEMGGREALYEDCRRCGRERTTYDPRDQGSVWGGRRPTA